MGKCVKECQIDAVVQVRSCDTVNIHFHITVLQVEELNIDNCKATHIVGLTDKFVNLQTLSMANSELSSLKGFPSLPNLRKVRLWFIC